MPRRNRRRRRRGRYPVWLKYLAWSIGVAVLVTLVQIVVQAVRSDPRDAQQYAERQLRLSALRPDERVIASVSVWQRPPIDYFRATRGILVLTDAPGDSARPIGGRLIYLGLQPRDALSPVDAPPTFDVRDWRVDTAVTLEPTRTMFYLARALRLQTPTEGLTFGVPVAAVPDADALRAALERKYAAIRVVGWQRREQSRAEARAAKVANSEGRRPWYHTVRRGEALASVAKMFNTTPEQIRALNHITGDRIRIGDRLMVKARTKQPVPFPSVARPEF